MSNIHAEILHNKSPFRDMAIAAWVIGVGDVLCVLADLYWLFGDMSIAIHPHHYVVLIGLSIATLLITASFIWLYMAVGKYLKKHGHIHTKHERLAAEVEALKNELKRIEYAVNTNRYRLLASSKDEEE